MGSETSKLFSLEAGVRVSVSVSVGVRVRVRLKVVHDAHGLQVGNNENFAVLHLVNRVIFTEAGGDLSRTRFLQG